jgi:hypothetical protein
VGLIQGRNSARLTDVVAPLIVTCPSRTSSRKSYSNDISIFLHFFISSRPDGLRYLWFQYCVLLCTFVRLSVSLLLSGQPEEMAQMQLGSGVKDHHPPVSPQTFHTASYRISYQQPRSGAAAGCSLQILWYYSQPANSFFAAGMVNGRQAGYGKFGETIGSYNGVVSSFTSLSHVFCLLAFLPH